MAIADAGFPAYKLTPLEIEVAKASADVRRYDTTVGAAVGLGIGALVGFVGLRKRRLPLKFFTTFFSTTLSTTFFFFSSTTVTMDEWGALDSPGRAAEGQISFMAEFARRMLTDKPETVYTNKQLHIFYRQQLRGEVMRILSEEEEREERDESEKQLKKSSSWW